jgi:hypothetical protein
MLLLDVRDHKNVVGFIAQLPSDAADGDARRAVSQRALRAEFRLVDGGVSGA